MFSIETSYIILLCAIFLIMLKQWINLAHLYRAIQEILNPEKKKSKNPFYFLTELIAISVELKTSPAIRFIKLYNDYSKLNMIPFKTAKNFWHSRNFDVSYTQQIVDLVNKFLIAFVVIGATYIFNMANPYINISSIKKAPIETTELEVTSIILGGAELIIFITRLAALLFIWALSDLLISSMRKQMYKEHLTIINDIIEERKEAKKK